MKQLFTISALCLLALHFCACGSPQGAGRNNGGNANSGIGTISNKYEEKRLSKSELAKLGDVRITYRQYALSSVVGKNGARPKDQTEVLVNQSHSKYDGASNEKLRRNEYFLLDGVMAQLISDFEDEGFFKPKESDVRRIRSNTTLEAYASRIRGVFKWIAVEYKGKTFIITRGSQAELSASEARWVRTFNRCELKILRATQNKLPKATVREESAEDLRRRRRELENARRNHRNR